MNEADAQQIWATLGEEGKAPTELTRASHVLPSYSVGIEPWLDRLSNRYLNNLCREAAHFKLVLAPYGGGKTHFLLALGTRALRENFAVAYVPCGDGVSLDSPMDLYREFIKHLELPSAGGRAGLRVFLERVVRAKREEIEAHGAPDVDAAFRRWVSTVRRDDYPENAFGRVMAAALEATDTPDWATVGDAAIRWLQGDVDTLSKEDMQGLRLARVPAANRKALGTNLLLSAMKFIPQAGVHGLVLLIDEVETLFTARGKALLRVLAAMRVILDVPTGVPGGLPLFGVFAAVPDVLEELRRYPAVEQRLAVRGAPFDEDNDLATQIPLDKIEDQETLLRRIGEKLIDVGRLATEHPFDQQIQAENATRLAQVAATRTLDMDARRMFVKTWVNLLQMQLASGERLIEPEELVRRYQGAFETLRDSDPGDFEP